MMTSLFREIESKRKVNVGALSLKSGRCLEQKKPLSKAIDRGCDHPILTFIQNIIEVIAFE